MATIDSTTYSYRHELIPTIGRFLFYVIVWFGIPSTAVMIAVQFKPRWISASVLINFYAISTFMILILATAMICRVLRTTKVVVGERMLQMPHYWASDVPYKSILGVYANRPQKGVVSIAVESQIIRLLKVRLLSPSTTADEFAALLHERVMKTLDDSKGAARLTANELGRRQLGNAWLSFLCSFVLVAIHSLAWKCGSRFDGLDFIASGASFRLVGMLSDPLRVVDSTLLHAHWPHVLTNFIGFVVYGSIIERVLGWRSVLVLFVIGSICSISASVLWSESILRVGASGGIMSLLGVFLYIALAKPFPIPGTMLGLPMWLFIPLSILGLGILVPGVDWVAHTAGVVTGIAAGAIMFRGAKQRAVDELLPVRIPPLLFMACVAVISVALIDVSMRITHLTKGGRAATIEQILQSHASSDLIADVAWEELIERRESKDAVPNTIAHLRQDRTLTPTGRSFLAALLAIHGDASAAFAEQRATLLSVASDDPARASRYAARLVRFSERVAPAQRLLASATDDCVETISVIRAANGAVPTVVRARIESLAAQLAKSEPAGETLATRAVAKSSCTPTQSTWRITAEDWRTTTTLFPR